MGNALSKVELDYGAMELEAEIYSNRGVGRQYRAHDDPEIDAGSRFMMLLRLQFVQKLLPLTEDNRDYLFHLAKNPKRARRVHEQFAYGWSQVGTTLWAVPAGRGGRGEVGGVQDRQTSIHRNAEAAPSPSEADSGVSGVPGPGPDGGRPDGGSRSPIDDVLET